MMLMVDSYSIICAINLTILRLLTSMNVVIQKWRHCLWRCHLHLQFYWILKRGDSRVNLKYKMMERSDNLILFWHWCKVTPSLPHIGPFTMAILPLHLHQGRPLLITQILVFGSKKLMLRYFALGTCFPPCLAMTWVMTSMLSLLCYILHYAEDRIVLWNWHWWKVS